MSITLRSLNLIEIESLLQQGCSCNLIVEDHNGSQQSIRSNSWDKVLVFCEEETVNNAKPMTLSWLNRIQRCCFQTFESPLSYQFVEELFSAENSVTLDGVILVSNKAALAGAVILGRFSYMKLSIPEIVKSSYWVHSVASYLPGEIEY